MANQNIKTEELCTAARRIKGGSDEPGSPRQRGLKGRDLCADDARTSAPQVRIPSGQASTPKEEKKGRGSRIGAFLAISLAAAACEAVSSNQDGDQDTAQDSVSDVATPDSFTDAGPDSVPDATPDSIPDVTPDVVPDADSITDSRDVPDSEVRPDGATPSCREASPPDSCTSTPAYVECSLQEGTDIEFDGIRFTPARLEGSDFEITSLNLYTGCVGSFGSAVVQPGGFSYIFTETAAYRISMNAEGTSIRIDKRPLSACTFGTTMNVHVGDPSHVEWGLLAVVDDVTPFSPLRAQVSVFSTETGESVRATWLRSNCAVGFTNNGTNYLLRAGVVGSYTPLTFAVCD